MPARSPLAVRSTNVEGGGAPASQPLKKVKKRRKSVGSTYEPAAVPPASESSEEGDAQPPAVAAPSDAERLQEALGEVDRLTFKLENLTQDVEDLQGALAASTLRCAALETELAAYRAGGEVPPADTTVADAAINSPRASSSPSLPPTVPAVAPVALTPPSPVPAAPPPPPPRESTSSIASSTRSSDMSFVDAEEHATGRASYDSTGRRISQPKPVEEEADEADEAAEAPTEQEAQAAEAPAAEAPAAEAPAAEAPAAETAPAPVAAATEPSADSDLPPCFPEPSLNLPADSDLPPCFPPVEEEELPTSKQATRRSRRKSVVSRDCLKGNKGAAGSGKAATSAPAPEPIVPLTPVATISGTFGVEARQRSPHGSAVSQCAVSLRVEAGPTVRLAVGPSSGLAAKPEEKVALAQAVSPQNEVAASPENATEETAPAQEEAQAEVAEAEATLEGAAVQEASPPEGPAAAEARPELEAASEVSSEPETNASPAVPLPEASLLEATADESALLGLALQTAADMADAAGAAIAPELQTSLRALFEQMGELAALQHSRQLGGKQKRKVRFAAHDLSGLSPPRLQQPGSDAGQDSAIELLTKIVAAQHALIPPVPASAAPGPVADSAASAALRWLHTALDAFGGAAGLVADMQTSARFYAREVEGWLSSGDAMLTTRLGELLSSSLRFHLNIIFSEEEGVENPDPLLRSVHARVREHAAAYGFDVGGGEGSEEHFGAAVSAALLMLHRNGALLRRDAPPAAAPPEPLFSEGEAAEGEAAEEGAPPKEASPVVAALLAAGAGDATALLELEPEVKDGLLRWAQAQSVLLQIFGPRDQLVRLQRSHSNQRHFDQLAALAASVHTLEIRDEAYFAPLRDLNEFQRQLHLDAGLAKATHEGLLVYGMNASRRGVRASSRTRR